MIFLIKKNIYITNIIWLPKIFVIFVEVPLPICNRW